MHSFQIFLFLKERENNQYDTLSVHGRQNLSIKKKIYKSNKYISATTALKNYLLLLLTVLQRDLFHLSKCDTVQS